MELGGRRVAVFGMGRSGIGAARLVAAHGGVPVVVDQGSPSSKSISDSAAQLARLGVDTRADWDGDVKPLQADWMVVSPGVPFDHPSLVQARSLGVPVLGEIELAYRLSKAPILAITGTNGKSTTTVMTWLCVRAMGFRAVLCGNIYGSGYPEQSLTEAALTAGPDDILVAEISSFQLETVSEFRPLAAAITQIKPDHISRHGSMAAYAEAKNRIFGAMGSDCRAVLPFNDAWAKAPAGPQTVRFGVAEGDAILPESGFRVMGETVIPDALPPLALHDRLNALVALCLAHHLARGDRQKFQNAASGLQSFRPLSHRLNILGTFRGVRFVNNSMCTNPAAVVASSASLKGRQLLLMGGVAKQTPFQEVGHLMRKSGHSAFVFGRDAELIARELAETGAERIVVCDDLDSAFRLAVAEAKDGDTVMLAPGCASQDQFADFRERGEKFEKLVEEWASQ